ncbi:MAG: hypothetical protein R2702_03850 [Acidimicrobiales bacterium]
MNNRFAFLPMRASNRLLDDPEALRARLEDDSYLLFRRVIDRDAILALRADVIAVLARLGWTDEAGRAITKPPLRQEDDEFRAGYQEIRSSSRSTPSPTTRASRRDARPPSARRPSAPLKIARILAFPDHYEEPRRRPTRTSRTTRAPRTSRPRGSRSARCATSWAAWPCCRAQPAGLLPARRTRGRRQPPGGRARRAVALAALGHHRLRYGDVLLFPSLAVHAALHNSSTFYPRLSVDFRYQLEGEALTAGCLEPHFQQLTWDEIYAGWASDEHQWYWRDLDYEVVPFRPSPPSTRATARPSTSRTSPPS